MKKLSKNQIQTLERLQQDWNIAKHALDTAIEEANNEISDLNDELQKQIDAVEAACEHLNNITSEMNDLREEIASEISNYIDERSDNWRDGDRGSSYQEWLDAWSNEIEEVEVETPSLVEDFADVDAETPLEESDYPREPSA